MTLVLLVLLLAGGLWYYGSQPAPTPTVSTYPTLLPADQVLVEDTSASSSLPAGFHALRDTQLNFTFNVPLGWKVQYLPEGDGRPSLISPDFSSSPDSMTGAYIHYTSDSLPGGPDGFTGRPDAYMALLKQQELAWTDTSLDGHPAFISKSDNGYIMIVSQFGDNWFVTISLADPGKKYSAVLDEFQRSFHAQ